jgi:hypothetical protein
MCIADAQMTPGVKRSVVSLFARPGHAPNQDEHLLQSADPYICLLRCDSSAGGVRAQHAMSNGNGGRFECVSISADDGVSGPRDDIGRNLLAVPLYKTCVSGGQTETSCCVYRERIW